MHPGFYEEAQLCTLLRAQNRDAYSYLYDRYAPAMLGEILRVVKQKSLAEDLLQEVFITIYRKFHTYDPEKGRLFTWLIILARHRAIDHQRCACARYAKGSMEVREDHRVEWPETEVLIEHRMLYRQMKYLKPSVRELLEMVYSYGYTHKQVALAQHIPLGTVKTRLRKGIEQLRSVCGIKSAGMVVAT